MFELESDLAEANALIAEALPACRFVEELASMSDVSIAQGGNAGLLQVKLAAIRDEARTLNGGFVPVDALREELAAVKRDREHLARQAERLLCSIVGEEHFERIPHEVVIEISAALDRGERIAGRYTDERLTKAANYLFKAIPAVGFGSEAQCETLVGDVCKFLGMVRA